MLGLFLYLSRLRGRSPRKARRVGEISRHTPAAVVRREPPPRPSPASGTAVPGKFSRVATSACSRGVFGNFWHSRLETANLSHLNHLSPFPGQPCASGRGRRGSGVAEEDGAVNAQQVLCRPGQASAASADPGSITTGLPVLNGAAATVLPTA